MKLIWLLPLLKKNLEREESVEKEIFMKNLLIFIKKAKIEKAVNLKKGSE